MTEISAFKCLCQACGTRLEAPSELAGTQMNCPVCGQQTLLDPNLDRTEEAAPPISREEMAAAFKGKVQTRPPSLRYNLGLGIVTAAMLVLPALYLLLIALAGWGVFYWAAHFSFFLKGRMVGFFLYATPLFAGSVLVIFMIKPLFARRLPCAQPLALNPASEPLLFSFIAQICRAVGAPLPSRIDLDCHLNASARFRKGARSMFRNDLVLTIGLPLAAGLNAQEFAGVVAHEFGHFTQGWGMRLTYAIRSVNHWFVRVVHERDSWDESLAEARASEDWEVALPAGIACLAVAFSRGILRLLMTAGHGIGCFMLRQMEYDADQYEIKLAGSGAFEAVCKRIRVLQAVLDGIYQNMQATWYLSQRLPENLPLLLAREDKRFPAIRRADLEDRLCFKRTKPLDTHPSAGDRIRRARQAGEPGIFHLDFPASALFSNFEAVAKQVTLAHYADDLKIPLERAELVPLNRQDEMPEEPPAAEIMPLFSRPPRLKIQRKKEV